MTVITKLNYDGRLECACGDPADVASSDYDRDFTLYLCRACAMCLARELVRDVATIVEAVDA